MSRPTIVWFRRDLRVPGNDSLARAVAHSAPIVPLYVLDEHAERPLGAASAAWLGSSLAALDGQLRQRGSSLVVRRGDTASVIAELCEETGARMVVAQRAWTPRSVEVQEEVAAVVHAANGVLELVGGAYLVEPDALETQDGGPYRVFSAYYKRWRERLRPSARNGVPGRLTAPDPLPPGETLPDDRLDESWGWQAGETSARRRLEEFAHDTVAGYGETRDVPGVDGTSRLSPHLCWGEISPETVAAEVWDRPGAEPFLRQLAWRDFAAHVLHHFPWTEERALRPEFDAMPWETDERAVEAWRSGVTGYPMVDAGMRQLADTGWMHNRARLVVGSFLTKHLLSDWQTGESHFWERLVDADLSQNVFNWQWIAGSGMDAAPYFRIFNPVLQGERFDPDGTYVHQWVPELGRLPAQWIHSPWRAPTEVLEDAGVRLGTEYPEPIVDHREARGRALRAFDVVKAARESS